ncbi:methyltransferase domain-containing protein [Erysipelothrix sp. HDW6C]|uniref:RlmE/FtsJ family methyltransferase n=1 Tax=Erysipelothrix sp. HDW6C TaxID=2714930 RepID=UPI00140E0B5D|nr:FtsJ-like methyltransferase family protein [Erysipelothrix sp. HDW6C]QIK68845.1 methyltransferase domain-containing protein [Erysipelothrix sp. HDW6C]
MRYFVTCNDNSNYLLDQEVKKHAGLGTLEWVSDTEAILDSKLEHEKLVDVIRSTPILFIRHLFKIDGEIALDEAPALPMKLNLEPNQTFSLQIRTPLDLRQRGIAIRNTIVDALIDQGFTLNVKDPEQIVSLYFTDSSILYGIGTSALQLSKWSAGMVHYSKAQSSISRAEFKLREVFESFNVPHVSGLALDLGAAPGGWTQVLTEQGFDVIAVDPAKLDPQLKKNTKVRHYKGSTQEYMQEFPNQMFDVMVNDMKMTVKQSIGIFNHLALNLNPDGYAVLTLKLPKEYNYDFILSTLSMVRRNFNIIEGRQLFHNRHELTLLLTKR